MKPVLPEISVVAPCYNEAESLPELHRRLTAVCAPLGVAYEIVLVDDGPTAIESLARPRARD